MWTRAPSTAKANSSTRSSRRSPRPTTRGITPPRSYRENALKHVRDAAALLESKATTEELDEVPALVLTLAGKVAAAHKEEGQSVSPAESEAIEQITAALGTTTS